MLVSDPVSGETLHVRRITLALKEPTRDGDTELHLLSNRPVQEARARKLVGVYGKRWTIETAFCELTTTLSCEVRTLGYPKAALFAFCLALVAYNYRSSKPRGDAHTGSNRGTTKCQAIICRWRSAKPTTA